MKKISWLHISDLHFGGHERYNQNVVTNSMLNDLKTTLTNKQKIIDFIFISGDITYSGQKSEFSLFDDFLSELQNITHVDNNNTVICPGNHDINRADLPLMVKDASSKIDNRDIVSKILGSKDEREKFLTGLKNYNDYILKRFPWANNSTEFNFSNTINYSLNDIKISVLSLNSSWLAVGNGNEKGELVLGERQVREALDRIDDPHIVISLMHHSFEWLKWFDKKDVKGMLDRRVDFILTGHEHIDDAFQKVSAITETFYFSSGSLYDSRSYNNTYNIVEIDFETGVNTILFRQYNDKNGGVWENSNQLSPEGDAVQFLLPERLQMQSLQHVEPINDYFQTEKDEIVIERIPVDLIDKIKNKECLLFAGAGASIDAGLPTWNELLLSLVEKVTDMGNFDRDEISEIKELMDSNDYLVVAEICRNKLGEYEFSKIIKNRLAAKNKISENQKIMSDIPFSGCLTTNYDPFVETYRNNSKVILPYQLNSMTMNEITSVMSEYFPVIKLHGTYEEADSIILTHSDYNKLIFNKINSNYRDNLKYIITNKSLFFIGFSFRDPNIDFTLQEVISTYGSSTIPHYAVVPDIGKLKAKYFWDNYNINIISFPIKKHGWEYFKKFLEELKDKTQ